MPKLTLSEIGLRAGIWQGVLTGTDAMPSLECVHNGQTLPGLTLQPRPEGGFVVQAPIPASVLSEGVQVFLIRDAASQTALAFFTLIAGAAAGDDLRAEVALLRAELELLKHSFRKTLSPPTAKD